MKQQGSALLIMLTTTALVSGLVMHLWFITSLHYDIVLARHTWYQNFYATDAALAYGVRYVKDHFNQFDLICQQRTKPTVLNITTLLQKHVPQQSKQWFIIVQRDAALKGRQLRVGACCVHNKKIQQILWILLQQHTHNAGDRQQVTYVATHYSFGSSI
jgi:hypothetical protein